jgi:uncharacterized protein YndB with AHSA1/START domain
MTVETLSSVRIQRHFDASPERVFDAWTNPEIARKWLFTTPASEKNTTEMDPRLGGKWTIADTRDGLDYKALGEYVEFDRPRRLVFTFGMPQFSEEFARVIVEIEPEGTGSILSITHERLPWAALSQTEQGWCEMLINLWPLLDRDSV